MPNKNSRKGWATVAIIDDGFLYPIPGNLPYRSVPFVYPRIIHSDTPQTRRESKPMSTPEPMSTPGQESFAPFRSQRQEGYHLIDEDMRLANDDGRAVRLGERVEMQYTSRVRWNYDTLTYEDIPIEELRANWPPQQCERGMHASPTIFEAMDYHNGPNVTQVVVEVDIHPDYDENVPIQSRKFAGRFRTIVAGPITTAELAKQVVVDLGLLTQRQVDKIEAEFERRKNESVWGFHREASWSTSLTYKTGRLTEAGKVARHFLLMAFADTYFERYPLVTALALKTLGGGHHGFRQYGDLSWSFSLDYDHPDWRKLIDKLATAMDAAFATVWARKTREDATNV